MLIQHLLRFWGIIGYWKGHSKPLRTAGYTYTEHLNTSKVYQQVGAGDCHYTKLGTASSSVIPPVTPRRPPHAAIDALGLFEM